MDLESAKAALIDAARILHARGWVPATSGNFSARLDDDTIAVTVSGRDKSRLAHDDIMRVDCDGRALEPKAASTELALHLMLYARDPSISAVLHTHSLNATVVSMQGRRELCFSGLELLKAFDGIATHETEISIPVFANTQDIDGLAAAVEAHMLRHGQGYAYLIRGHGLYTWGRSIAESLRHLEALEFLLDYFRQANAAG